MNQQHDAHNETLLIVDDEPDMCDMLKAYMTQQGFKVLCANNAAEAREQLNAEKINILILDINMPGESGLDLLRSLQPENK